jgi:hypothetical protein
MPAYSLPAWIERDRDRMKGIRNNFEIKLKMQSPKEMPLSPCTQKRAWLFPHGFRRQNCHLRPK